MTYFPKDTFYSLLGEAYEISRNGEGMYEIWHWSNEKSGWHCMRKMYPTYQEAFEVMLGISWFTLEAVDGYYSN